jgi:hypothetical protein
MAAGSKSPYKPCLLSDVPKLIDSDLAQYHIVSAHSFVKPWVTAIAHGTVPHRCLLELRLDDKKPWPKLERISDSKIALRGFGRTTGKDEVGC